MMIEITASRHFESVKRTFESIASAEIAKNTRLATRHRATGSSGDRDVGVMNVMWSWGIEAPLSPLSPENLTEWLGYAAPLTKINYICWKIFQHFFRSPTLSTRLPFFILLFFLSKIFVAFLALIHQRAMGPSAVKRDAHTVPLCFIMKRTLRLQRRSRKRRSRWLKQSWTPSRLPNLTGCIYLFILHHIGKCEVALKLHILNRQL